MAQVNMIYSSSSSSQNFSKIKLGAKGAEVRNIQQILKTKGFYWGKIDGSYGPMTRSAVRNFQINNNLTATGEVDNNTFAQLKGIKTTPPSPKTPPLTITSYSPLSDGRVGYAYNNSIFATGGSDSYFWRIASGILPPGLSLTSAVCITTPCQVPVTITGTPTTPGTYIFLLEVSHNPPVGSLSLIKATKQFILTIYR